MYDFSIACVIDIYIYIYRLATAPILIYPTIDFPLEFPIEVIKVFLFKVLCSPR